jgi:hypothetical protein
LLKDEGFFGEENIQVIYNHTAPTEVPDRDHSKLIGGITMNKVLIQIDSNKMQVHLTPLQRLIQGYQVLPYAGCSRRGS